jgi:hypothetical protein
MSDTPETDALGTFTVFDHAGQPYQSDLVPGDFARRLERERDALKKQVDQTPKVGDVYTLKANNLDVVITDVKISIEFKSMFSCKKNGVLAMKHSRYWEPEEFYKKFNKTK